MYVSSSSPTRKPGALVPGGSVCLKFKNLPGKWMLTKNIPGPGASSAYQLLLE